MNNLRTYLLAALVGLLFTLPTQSVFANGDSDCPGESCEAPGRGRGGASADANARARASASASSRSSSGALAVNKLTVEGDEGTDGSDYPGTPASVYATRCANGASVSFPGGGATVTANDKFCNRLALAAFYAQVLNDPNKAREIVVVAEDRLNRSGRLFGIPRLLHLDELPLVGPFLFGN